MKTLAFTDANGGYYQCEVADSDPAPEWAMALTPCEVQAAPATAILPITPRQIRMALSRAGLRSTVEAAVAAGDQDLKDWWEFSQTFERGHPEVIGVATALGQTSEQIDALWTLGATL